MLQEQLNNLLAQSEHCKSNPALRIKIKTVQSRLKRITEQKVKGTMMRSKARWTEYGEKNTRYFLNLEKRKAEKKRIVELYLEDGTVTENQDTILKEEENFFSSVFISQVIIIQKQQIAKPFSKTKQLNH